MATRSAEGRKRNLRQMFARLAPRYDLMNRIMTLGYDQRWRRETIDHLFLNEHGRVLDLGTGTGELAFEIFRRTPRTRIVGVDITPEMIRLAHERDRHAAVGWVIADVEQLPFAGAAFDAVVSGFVLRNVVDIDRALEEQNRILKPRGCIACLETTPPGRNIVSRVVGFYMRRIVPFLGRLFSGDGEAYRYLERSTQTFLPTHALSRRIRAANFAAVQFSHHIFGNVAIHWARKIQG
jgi:demethylmenaquinone methyltransferase/2-methoxy-6-polyprenyl-1,4-benzoquinol methylase